MILRSALILISLGLCYGLYVLDPSSKLGLTFDGIGAISGGGATSKLLVDYPEKERDEILDYLFKPNFGASIQMFKVEIGGDAQTSDGTESSHMHESWEENYNRGYEWWLMKEAKLRNPSIKFLGLPWAFPAWIGEDNDPFRFPQRAATYVVKWILGAKKHHDIDIEYIGIWNERGFRPEYVKTLKKTLLDNKLNNVKIIFADGSSWDEVVKAFKEDHELEKIVDIVGVHYPGTVSTPKVQATGKPLWSVEDYSTHNKYNGAACQARILNQNYVNGKMTSTIVWNLIASYYGGGFKWIYMGLMTANEPWSGHYDISNPIWATAHTTQFTSIGWTYLNHGSGVGMLEKGGSYVTLVNEDGKEFTMVIETMSHDHSQCVRPALPDYKVTNQVAEFELKGRMSHIEKFYVWKTDLKTKKVFEKVGPIMPKNNKFKLALEPDQIYTLTTLTVGMKGSYGTPPKESPFPTSYFDDFEDGEIDQEAKYFSPQNGVWEVQQESAENPNKVNRQVVLQKPIDWCPEKVRCDLTINMGGNYDWKDVDLSVDVLMPSVNRTTGAFIGARIKEGGCEACISEGVFFAVYPGHNTYQIYTRSNKTQVISSGIMKSHVKYNSRKGVINSALIKSVTFVKYDTWHKLGMSLRGNKVSVTFDGKAVATAFVPRHIKNGFVAYGTTTFGVADFDNFKIENASTK